jgi:transposase-like protein
MKYVQATPLSCGDHSGLCSMMQERGVDVDASRIFRWVQCYAPEFGKRTTISFAGALKGLGQLTNDG